MSTAGGLADESAGRPLPHTEAEGSVRSSRPRLMWRRGNRVRGSRDFVACLRVRPRRGKQMLIYVRRTDRPYSRLGVIISRKVGNAVKRNRLRRRIREAFRTHRHMITQSVDVVVRTLPGSARLSYRDCVNEIVAPLIKSKP